MSSYLPSWKKRKFDTPSTNHVNSSNDAQFYSENSHRRSQRVGEATHTAQTQLALRKQELNALQDKYGRLERQLENLKAHNENVKRDRDGIKRDRDSLQRKSAWFADRFEYVLAHAVRPYARLRGERYSGNDDDLQDIIVSLLHDATEVKKLRIEVQKLGSEASTTNEVEELSQDLQQALEVNKKLYDRIHTLKKQNTEWREMQERASSSQVDAEEVAHLRDQVEKLQNDALAKLEKVEVIADAQFAQDFHAIISMVRTMSRAARVSNDTNLRSMLQGGILLGDIAESLWQTRGQKKCLIEAWIWSGLIHFVFATPFRIFHDDGDAVVTAWSKMFGMGGSRSWPDPTAATESWRRSTFEHMMNVAGRPVIEHGELAASQLLPKDAEPGLQRDVVQSRATFAEMLILSLSELAPTIEKSDIRKLVDKAYTMGMTMALQRARLRVVFPKVGVDFNNEQMASKPDRSGEDIEDGTVAFVVNPGLAKWGDAEGRNYDCRYDIVPSLVQLKPFTAQEAVKSSVDEVVVKVEPGLIKEESEV